MNGQLEAGRCQLLADFVGKRADVYFGRGQTILLQRERIKRHTITQRRLHHQRQAA
jgi:hypothetical protein